MIEIEVQNETHQTQERLRFAALPRIGEGIRLLEPNGFWSSYDIIDLWYQKAEYGDVWVPYIHVRITPSDEVSEPVTMSKVQPDEQQEIVDQAKTIAHILNGHEDAQERGAVPFSKV
ncbi:hypothetical protein [Novosphingobium mangrovi (ex Huang et al. 2023)]|uniref:Uncharacterized protein n=1 Tax=Novosphingobium mangrovi (ex Huang et al. 2023) TaxID=2976432 RepID=A0ABT2I490_9SPHN|nr:hypothetical protein [Novosphingobium mangrovi (ex Huang et al. 2023)]MCT2399624.1 hypothetical protein [Novosphingobium mangrovi (ex Huang et al. 2023)]